MPSIEAKKGAGIFANRNFRLLFSGKIVSQLGDQVYAFALSWYVLDRTGSGFQMAVFLVVDSLTLALLSPFGGALADRVDRKAMLVWMDLARGAVVVAGAVLLYFGALEIWMLYVGAIALPFCGAIFNPAAGAIIPDIVSEEELPRAMSMNQFSWSFCAIVGMVAGGLVYSFAGAAAVFAINALSFLASAALEARIVLGREPRRGRGREPGWTTLRPEARRIARELAEGYRYVKGDRLIFSLCLMYAVYNALLMPIGFVYFPYIFNVMLKASSFQLALAMGSLFIGMMAASFVVPRFLHKYRLRDGIFWGLLVLCACQLVFIGAVLTPLGARLGNWGITAVMFLISLVLGVATTFFNVPIGIVLQQRAADEFRGRFWGFFGSITSLSIPVGYALGGALTTRVPMWAIFAGSTLVFLALDLWIVNVRELRELRSEGALPGSLDEEDGAVAQEGVDAAVRGEPVGG
jgi:MFS transporter, DHA3 family, macrolide efflux protein